MSTLFPAAEPALSSTTKDPHTPPLGRVFLFRFGFVYLMVMAVATSACEDVGVVWLGKLVRPIWNPIVVWVGTHVLRISSAIDTSINGSGDKTADWIGLFIAATTAMLAAVLWTAIDRRRVEHPQLRAFLHLFLRYFVAAALLGYGLAKVFCLQFPSPDDGRLSQPYGESSPMGLLWTLMGFSPAYQVFGGAIEVLGAVLLLFRRTTALGAFILSVVLANIVMLNLSFDVPVKIGSAHYFAMCVVVLSPRLGPLANVLLFNRATLPVVAPRLAVSMRIGRAGWVLKAGVIVLIAYANLQPMLAWRARRSFDGWPSGSWAANKFVRDGRDLPPSLDDGARWRRLRVEQYESGLYARWHFMNRTRGDLYKAVIDEPQHVITLSLADPKPGTPVAGPVVFRYQRTDDVHLVLDGQVDGANLHVELERFDPGKTRLMSRGFRWINEGPYNR